MSCEKNISPSISNPRMMGFAGIGFNPRGSLQPIWQEWVRLKAQSSFAIPEKAHLTMRGFRGALPDIIIAERSGKDDITICLSGTRIDEMMGGVVTGCNLLDLVPYAQRDRINNVYENIAQFSCGFYISEDVSLSDRKPMELDILALPIADREGSSRFYLTGYHVSNRHYFNPFAEQGAKLRPRHINHAGYLELGGGTPNL